MIEVITCPEEKTFDCWDTSTSVFLAGGITGCPDWQAEVIELLKGDDAPLVNPHREDITLINPRRKDFDVNDPKMSKYQIDWEHRHISNSDIIFFWFPEETLCPITLFELGKALGLGVTVVAGCHPNYARRFDVIEQIGHMNPFVVVQDTIKGTLRELRVIL